jgi:NAD(P)-dependent dehydrogenase (short-subunit alcohol dehydrogenase family)
MTFNPFNLEKKKILITGASAGIGRTIAIECSKIGATIFSLGRNIEGLVETNERLYGKDHHIIQADLVNFEDYKNLITKLPNLDGVVYSSGLARMISGAYFNEKNIDETFNINLKAPILLTSQLLKKKKISNYGSVVFISSISSIVGIEGNSIYAASKSGLVGSLKALSLEFSNKKIRFNSISPGLILTNLIKNTLTEESITKSENLHPLGLGTPEDVAYASIYLLSDASRWITGTNLIIDGGYSAR